MNDYDWALEPARWAVVVVLGAVAITLGYLIVFEGW